MYSLQKVDRSPGTLYAAMGLTRVFYSIPLKKDTQKQGQQYTFTVPSQNHVSSPALRHNIVLRDLEHFDILQNIILAITIMVLCYLDLVSRKNHTP